MPWQDCQIGRRTVRAFNYRQTWEVANGRLLRPDEIVMHLCDEPRCINPKHLRAGTQGENLHDAATKGRLAGSIHGPGEAHRFAKLTTDDVLTIRGAVASGETQRAVARRFGVHQSAVSRIVRGVRWGHIGGESHAVAH